MFQKWKDRARSIRSRAFALYFAYRDPRIPWYAKALIALVVAYAFSPIDLIPDFIPILGYIDDLILLPLGITIAIRMIPKEVLEESIIKAESLLSERKPRNWVVAGLIIGIWLLLFVFVAITIFKRLMG